MRSPLDAYRRWCHGRGFGVHSPWAYRLITEALRCPHAFYDDRAVNHIFGRDAHTARQVYRVLALENCRVTGIVGGDDRWQNLAAMASPEGRCPTLLVIGDFVADTVVAGVERVIIVSSDTASWLNLLMAESHRCLAVTNGRSLAVANLTDAANKQIIEAKF